jgi:hypothetical protein
VQGIRGFRDLKVWQKAMDAAMAVLASMAAHPEHWSLRKR